MGPTHGNPAATLRFPGIVFECDQTELAVERVVAAAILIDVEG